MGEYGTEGLDEDRVALERVESLLLRGRQPHDSRGVACVLRDRRRVDLDRLGRLDSALEAVEAGRDQPADGEVRVRARVRRLQLGVRRRLLHAREDGRDAYRRLAVIVAPPGERAGP